MARTIFPRNLHLEFPCGQGEFVGQLAFAPPVLIRKNNPDIGREAGDAPVGVNLNSDVRDRIDQMPSRGQTPVGNPIECVMGEYLMATARLNRPQ